MTDNHTTSGAKVPLRDLARCHALASPTMLKLYWQPREKPLKSLRVARPGDDAVIDGFPRSSNTFATHAFFLTQGDDVKLGNHVHSAGQFVLAQRYGVPAMLVLRDPVQATLSLSVFDKRYTPPVAYYWYNLFHRKMLELEDFIVAPFPEVTSDFGRTIERMNERFGTDFKPFHHSEESSDAVFARMAREREKRADALGELYRNPMRVAQPTADKDTQKQAMKAAFKDPALDGPKAEARELFEALMQRAEA
ncbi:hypothetical protein ACFCW2_13395 [Qipengyuania sp. DSG2-2]|uniref:hypothetical protein n=1 Tax=Qipengyuania sp. DGS2-2 TaxID=3349631 RepID=UPI0036D24BC5